MFVMSFCRAGLALVLVMSLAPAIAQQPTFPFLQDGGPRMAFVGGVYDSCLKTQRSHADNASASTSELGAYCLCFGRALADTVNGSEYEMMTAGKRADSLVAKQRKASDVCRSLMNSSEQTSPAMQRKVELHNMCRREYHPEDTDHAAAVIREKFCGCYANVMIQPGSSGKSAREVQARCEKF